MEHTKERILIEALKLFAREGYEAVSVRDIAGRLGISQSALYKHYAGKRHIFDSIAARMEQADAERAGAFEMPKQRFCDSAEAYRETTRQKLREYTIAQFHYWTEDAFASAFRRMLTLEQYRSPEMTALYQQYLSGGIIQYLEDLFREMGDWEQSKRHREIEEQKQGSLHGEMSDRDAKMQPRNTPERGKMELKAVESARKYQPQNTPERGGTGQSRQSTSQEMRAPIQTAAEENNPRQLALEFYGPLYMLMNLYDGAADDAERSRVNSLAETHIRTFLNRKRTENGTLLF